MEISKQYLAIEEELDELKAYGFMQYAIIKNVVVDGVSTEGTEAMVAHIIETGIKEVCDRIGYKLNSISDDDSD